MGRLADSMSAKGEKAGSALSKGFVRGISKNTGLRGQAAAALARQVAHQAGIPAMAAGGIVTRPTLAMIGEGRVPEAVIPLDGRHGLGGGVHYHTNIYTSAVITNKRELDRIVRDSRGLAAASGIG
jgi:SLT domain-containing protein